MFLTIETTAPGADDLGYVLGKHPGRVQSFDVSAGQAAVFYPVAGPDRCQVALLVDVDAAKLAASRGFRHDDHALSSFVNDRAYAASSLLSVAIAKVFSSALHGACADRPELAERAWPLTIHVPTACGSAKMVRWLFEPLGWTVETLGETEPVDLTLTGTFRVQDALAHLYILLPVLDDAKHYWVGEFETEKLVRHGGSWLPGHPARGLITRRYLAHQRPYIADATSRLLATDDAEPDEDDTEETEDATLADEPVDAPTEESPSEKSPTDDSLSDESPKDEPDDSPERRPKLADQRRDAIIAALTALGAHSVVDLGCGEGRLIRALLKDSRFTQIVGADVSASVLTRAQAALARRPERARHRVTLLQTSATYRDARLGGFDAIVLSEVIEHIDPDRLPALAQSVFGDARPAHVLITTPNCEYNATYPALADGGMRHRDHRFEWTRAEFAAWADGIAAEHGYQVVFDTIGPVDPDLGSPTQMAIFSRRAS